MFPRKGKMISKSPSCGTQAMKQNIKQNVVQLLSCVSPVATVSRESAEALQREAKFREDFPKLSNKYKLKVIQFD